MTVIQNKSICTNLSITFSSMVFVMAPSSRSPREIYLDHLRKGQLAFQRDAAGAPIFFPRVVSPAGDTNLRWEISKGLGTIYSTTAIRPKNCLPYNVSLVDLDEGFRLMSRVEGEPSKIRIGSRVRVRILDEGAEPIPVFDLVMPSEVGQ
ncbi:Zn-ribbon domain-containing OB-fold protein [Bradyrhizobium sp. STM 3561]|uniref:Zn-ribbon domain-containing OB-fold protein n=1 Tax=Bradyrhizobium sp. STM 3561 TaxID=578923 RepID=UPI00388E5D50